MFAHLTRLSLLSLLLLSACQKAPAPQASHAGHTGAPAGIEWFNGGSVDQAFEAARRENRPVLLYWGAEWCPFCHTLKAEVFARPDFIAKTRLFVPVYLDGDQPGAQRWGDVFHIEGYPTMIILDPDRHEIMRLGAGRDVAQYAAVLDVALENVQPADVLLSRAATGASLSLDECRRLADNAWELSPVDSSGQAVRAHALAAAAAGCPPAAERERAELYIYAAYYEANIQAGVADHPHAQLPPELSALQDQVRAVLSRHDLAVQTASALAMLDSPFFRSVRMRPAPFPQQFRDAYMRDLGDAARDPRYVLADQLQFIDARLRALKILEPPGAALPAEVALDARQRVDAALSHEQSPYVRPGLVNAALNILEDLGDLPAAYQVAHAEIARALSPYYFEADLAGIAEQMGHRDEALRLLSDAYRDSRGDATRFQWGQMYLSGLLRMAPQDSQRIAAAGEAVLGELDGPGRISRRTRVRLEKLDRELRAWNAAAGGTHEGVLRTLRGRMQQICIHVPQGDAARASCDAFLRAA